MFLGRKNTFFERFSPRAIFWSKKLEFSGLENPPGAITITFLPQSESDNFREKNQRGEGSASAHLVHRRSAAHAHPPSPTQAPPKDRGRSRECEWWGLPPPCRLLSSLCILGGPGSGLGWAWVAERRWARCRSSSTAVQSQYLLLSSMCSNHRGAL